MIDLFYPPKIYPRPTRTVNLTGEPEPGAVLPYKPRPSARAEVSADPKIERERAKSAKWHRDALRSDAQFRKEKNKRERERYASMSPEQRAAVLERNKAYKRKTRGGKRGD
jgi:hypothetical protein